MEWFTQPENSFASYYYYENNTLIRIRLELNREVWIENEILLDNGFPIISIESNRAVGFSNEFRFTFNDIFLKHSLPAGNINVYKRREPDVYDYYGLEDIDIYEYDPIEKCEYSLLGTLNTNPLIGHNTFDFTIRNSDFYENDYHLGNKVVEELFAKLPSYGFFKVTSEHLRSIAQKAIRGEINEMDLVLLNSRDDSIENENELARKLFELSGFPLF